MTPWDPAIIKGPHLIPAFVDPLTKAIRKPFLSEDLFLETVDGNSQFIITTGNRPHQMIAKKINEVVGEEVDHASTQYVCSPDSMYQVDPKSHVY